MPSREEIKEAIKTCIAIEQSCGEFDGNRLAEHIMLVENELGLVIKVDGELPTMEQLKRLSKLSGDALAVREFYLHNSVVVESLIDDNNK